MILVWTRRRISLFHRIRLDVCEPIAVSPITQILFLNFRERLAAAGRPGSRHSFDHVQIGIMLERILPLTDPIDENMRPDPGDPDFPFEDPCQDSREPLWPPNKYSLAA